MSLQKNLKIIYIILSIFFFSTATNSNEIFISLKNNKVNVRYGPSFDFPIKYIYKKIYLPVKQIDKKENWRRIINLKNNSGWIHKSQLQATNAIILLKDKILFKKPSNFSKPLAKIKRGRMLVLQKCNNGWCKIKTKEFTGWVTTNNIWGSVN